ncbi:hypothetical protein TTHERM_000304275 (macronuclear) [Tetrahymena thermophila SB210]|uniref:Uncharacterized protein n=1 Tax=Tetrahymena thermophila (strain SB210) TaxID=312017 RepID=W7X9N9_TETTS|nr:hypothetical protein TTHERM_000304275 [Tetrahymena thermophila SB210]EWS73118.1 hypothetical protein TTHERM_000304275 [Tetrahymena thermophila SB210]|eukprot:XP_012654305.1 hypothetical protein TTHERM_000304275 [Tetrahymena thermophila SB210]
MGQPSEQQPFYKLETQNSYIKNGQSQDFGGCGGLYIYQSKSNKTELQKINFQNNKAYLTGNDYSFEIEEILIHKIEELNLDLKNPYAIIKTDQFLYQGLTYVVSLSFKINNQIFSDFNQDSSFENILVQIRATTKYQMGVNYKEWKELMFKKEVSIHLYADIANKAKQIMIKHSANPARFINFKNALQIILFCKILIGDQIILQTLIKYINAHLILRAVFQEAELGILYAIKVTSEHNAQIATLMEFTGVKSIQFKETFNVQNATQQNLIQQN